MYLYKHTPIQYLGSPSLQLNNALLNIRTESKFDTKQNPSPNENKTPDEYLHYLKALYASLTPTQVSTDTWPPSVTRKVFNLAMIKSTVVHRGQIQDKFVRMTIMGKVDDIMQGKYPIQLKDIFNETEGNRKVVLLEGAPGCGKSTLSVYIPQQWGEGKLFTEFKYVILIQL